MRSRRIGSIDVVVRNGMRRIALYLLVMAGSCGTTFLYGAEYSAYREPPTLNHAPTIMVLLLIVIAWVVVSIFLRLQNRATRARKRRAFLEQLARDDHFDLQGIDDLGCQYWVDTTKRTAVLLSADGGPAEITADDLMSVAVFSAGGYKSAESCLEFKFCDPARAVAKLHFSGRSGQAEFLLAKLRAAGFNRQDYARTSLVARRRLPSTAAPTSCPDCDWRRGDCKVRT